MIPLVTWEYEGKNSSNEFILSWVGCINIYVGILGPIYHPCDILARTLSGRAVIDTARINEPARNPCQLLISLTSQNIVSYVNSYWLG